MKNNFQKLPIFVSILLFILLGAALVFLYKQIKTTNEKAEERINNSKMEVQRLEDLKSLDRSLKNIESGVTLLDTHFAKGSDVVPFLDTIEKLAPKVGVTAEVNSVNNVANGAELVVELESRGSFAGVYKFLTLLENSPYQLEFLSMDLRKVTEGDDLSSVEWQGVFRIRLLGFIQ